MSTLAVRKQLVAIARQNVGKVEVTRNQAPWIEKLWTATNYPQGHDERQPYCAAGMAWTLREWLKLPEALAALQMTPERADIWRCKSASCFRDANSWSRWATRHGLQRLGPQDNFHTGDLVIYNYSHIELYVDDLPGGKFLAIGYNTDSGASRDGDGCWEKSRSRTRIREVFRLLQ